MTSKTTASACGRRPAARGRTPFRAALRLALATGLLGWAAQAAAQTIGVAANTVVVTEGNAGSITLGVPVLRGSTSGVIGLVYETAADPIAPVQATPGSDYTAVIRGIATIADGASLGSLPVQITGDTAIEPDEGFLVRLLSATNAGPMPAFGGAIDFTAGSNPRDSIAADFNGDGRPDLAVADQAAGVLIFFNSTPAGNSAAAFASAGTLPGNLASSIVAADLNGDGRPDLVVGNVGDDRLAIFLNATSPGASTASFSNCCSIASGGRTPVGLAVADFNGDGRPDLVSANNNSSNVSVFLNTSAAGTASLSFTAPLVLASGAAPHRLVVTDIDSDGRLDVVTANQVSSSVSVFRNTTAVGAAAASFAAAIDVPVGDFSSNTWAVAFGDVNGDGRTDLAATNINRGTVVLRLNTTVAGSGTIQFAPNVAFDTGGSARSVALCDINGDGRPDIVAGNRDGSSLAVLLNLTAPGYSSPSFASVVTYPSGIRPEALVVADFNGDWLPDAALAAVGEVSVFVNTMVPPLPAAAFTAPAAFQAGGPGSRAVAIDDFNGDGRRDLAVARESGALAVLLNISAPGDSAASFAAATSFATPGALSSVASGDLNGDGRPDLAAVSPNRDSVLVWFNGTAPGAAAVSLGTLQTFATALGPSSVAMSDLNRDGKPDLAVAYANSSLLSVFINVTAAGASVPSFAARADLASGNGSLSMAVADFNGDGLPDLVTTHVSTAQVSVHINQTAIAATAVSFPRTTVNVQSGPIFVAAGDLNGDGRPDLAVARPNDNSVSVLFNTTAPGSGVPSFTTPAVYGTNAAPYGIAIGDVDGDARPDLSVAGYNGAGLSSLLINRTAPGAMTPQFGSGGGLATGGPAISVASADLNGDGRRDLAFALYNDTTVSVLLNQLYAASLGSPRESRVVIANDDVPALSINDVTLAEGNSGTTAFTFTVSLAAASPNPVSVNYSTQDGSALSIGDFVAASGSLSFEPGETSKTVTVTVNGDTRFENDETFMVALSGAAGATVTRNIGTATIVNDDTRPTVRIDTMGVSAGEAVGYVVVTVTLSNASDEFIQVPFTVGGTAGVGDRSVSASPLSFAPGETGKTITITVVDDAIDEDDESVSLELGAPSNASLGSPTTFALTILDNDEAPTIRFENASASVDEGAGVARVRVVLSAASGRTVSVPVSLAFGSASPLDLILGGGGSISIAPGDTYADLDLTIVEDSLDETDETASLSLGIPANATLAVPFGHSLTIVDNDAPPLVSLSAGPASIGEAGGTATVTASLSAASGQPVTVQLALGGTAGSGDYGISSVELLIPPGATGASVTITATDDALDEADETVVASIASAVNATAGSPASATTTIVDNDAPPLVSLSVAPASIGEAGGSATVTATLSGSSSFPVTVNLGYSGTAGSGDYASSGSAIAIPAGATSGSVTITATDDVLDEADETVVASIASAVNATAGSPASATTTIVDDDAPPLVSLSAAPASIGEAGGSATVTATLSGPSSFPVTVNLGYAGTAGSGDYASSGSAIAIPAGATSGLVTITATQDALHEGAETVVASIVSAVNATATGGSITVTVVDDDAPPAVRFAVAAQGAAEAVGTVTISVQLSAVSGLPVTVPVAITGGTAGAGDRGAPSVASLSFAPGTTTASFSLPIANDALYEATETVVIGLGTPVNAVLGSPASHTVSIADDDAEAVASISLSPASATRQTLESQCVTALARDIGGTPLPNLSIGFVRTGANAGSGSAATDAAGNAQHCWTGANGGSDRVRASFGGVSSAESTITWTKRATVVDADGVITVQLSGPIRVQLAPRAVLRSGGAPLAGREIRFRTGLKPICAAVSDANGVARCTATIAGTVNGVVRNGFVADFDGDAAYLASSDKGAIVELK